MALMKGGNTAPEQMQDTAYTPEQQREIKLGMIMLKARRVWRIFCLVMCGIGLLFSVFNTIAYGQSFIGGILSVIIGWALLYVFVLIFGLSMTTLARISPFSAVSARARRRALSTRSYFSALPIPTLEG